MMPQLCNKCLKKLYNWGAPKFHGKTSLAVFVVLLPAREAVGVAPTVLRDHYPDGGFGRRVEMRLLLNVWAYLHAGASFRGNCPHGYDRLNLRTRAAGAPSE